MIHLTIDGNPVECAETITILEAARSVGIRIPTLCHNDNLKPYGACRICLVEAATAQRPDAGKFVVACCSQIKEGQVIRTNTRQIRELRHFIIELLLSRSPHSEVLQQLAKELGVPEAPNELDPVGRYLFTVAKPLTETKCILCGMCVRVCAEITERHAISFAARGMQRTVVTPFGKIAETCIGCGACAYVCPTHAITIEEAT